VKKKSVTLNKLLQEIDYVTYKTKY
jgi:hypothetical protein